MLIYLKGFNFRNFVTLEIKTKPFFNFFYGLNGSGKTSILEAINFLGNGKSFRSHQPQRVIHHQADKFTLYAEFQFSDANVMTVGIERERQGANRNKINGEIIVGAAPLAQALPQLLINQDSYSLIENGPKERRQFLNWGMFHVEQEFLPLWKQLQQVVSQRNALLRTYPTVKILKPWDEELIRISLALDELRKRYLATYLPIFKQITAQFLPLYAINIDYYPGWRLEADLQQVLETSRGRDMQLGYTQYGAHRADLRQTLLDRPVEDCLSRGEQKLLLYSLKLAQGIHLYQQHAKPTMYLIDDLLAELDINHQAMVINLLCNMQAQVFITVTHLKHLEFLFKNINPMVFHVEHGQITVVS